MIGDIHRSMFLKGTCKGQKGRGNAEDILARARQLDKEKKYAEAFALYKQAADLGSAEAAWCTAIDYYNGEGTDRDMVKFARYLIMAAEGGETQAYSRAGMAYRFGKGVESDDAKAYRYYAKAAEAGDTRAYVPLGEFCEHGWGVEKDEAKAFGFYCKGVEAGVAEACWHAAYCYKSGSGVERNWQKAFALYRLGAEAGDAYACENLARCYLYGDNESMEHEEWRAWYRDKENIEKGIYWLKKAIEYFSKEREAGNPYTLMGSLYYEMAFALDRLERYDEALECVEKMMAEHSSCDDTDYYAKAQILHHAGRYNEALTWAKKAKDAGAKDADKLIEEIREATAKTGGTESAPANPDEAKRSV